MTLDELISTTRAILRDTALPYLWSDELVTMYLNEGQERVARLTHAFIPDRRELGLSAGEDMYALDADVIYVYSVQLDGYPDRLAPATDGWTPSDSTPSRPTRYTLDTESGYIRFYNVPDATYTALLRIARLPIAMSDSTPACELMPKFQLALPDWAAYRCFTHDDADGRDDKAADRARLRFDDQISDIKYELYRLQAGFVPRVHGLRVK